MELERFRNNPKTAYLATVCDNLAKKIDELLKLSSENSEMKKMAETEIAQLAEQRENIIKQMENILKEKKTADENESGGLILEIRAGAGGEEAALFAEELGQMYGKFAASRGYSFSKLDESRAELGGYKEAVFEVKGKRAYESARKGGTPALKPKKVTVYNIELLGYKYPELKIRTMVSSGTYIRALARDIGRELGTGAFV